MTTNLQVGDRFPILNYRITTMNQCGLSQFTQPSLMDKKLGFLDGYPLILVFYRFFVRVIGSNCPS